MIQKLVEALTTLLQNSLKDGFSAPDKQIRAGLHPAPASDSLPFIALYPGKLTVSQKAREVNLAEARPQELREVLKTSANKAGPYSLQRTPLPGSARGRLIYDQDKVTERSVLLLENQDFTLDYNKGTVTFSNPIPKNGTALMRYSYAGIFTVREFAQDLFIDVYGADAATAEKWSAVAMALVLTAQSDLLDQFNADGSGYNGGPFGAGATIDQLWLVEANPDPAATPLKTQLHFQAQGQLKLTREMSDAAALITKIHSPGRSSNFPVDIEVLLD